MINVTKTFFPPIKEYNKQVQRIWNNQWLTNRGELVIELEEKLKEYRTAKATLQFQFDKPVPVRLITKNAKYAAKVNLEKEALKNLN